jgi:hypothetical protein
VLVYVHCAGLRWVDEKRRDFRARDYETFQKLVELTQVAKDFWGKSCAGAALPKLIVSMWSWRDFGWGKSSNALVFDWEQPIGIDRYLLRRGQLTNSAGEIQTIQRTLLLASFDL